MKMIYELFRINEIMIIKSDLIKISKKIMKMIYELFRINEMMISKTKMLEKNLELQILNKEDFFKKILRVFLL